REMLLPSGASEKYRSSQIVWNTLEQIVDRKNARPAFQFMGALPDDKCISVKDRIDLAKGFMEQEFVSKGFVVEVFVHPPESKVDPDPENLERASITRNWHFHAIISSRICDGPDGTFGKEVPKEFIHTKGKGGIVGTLYGPRWGKYQDDYFIKKGYDLRVDPVGVVGQKHIGPVRLRGECAELILENNESARISKELAQNPKTLLANLVIKLEVFTISDVRNIVDHFHRKESENFLDLFFSQSDVVPLYDLESGARSAYFTSKDILQENRAFNRTVDRIYGRSSVKIGSELSPFIEKLNDEQKQAFSEVVSGKRLALLEGHAGTGKSYVLQSLQQIYESNGYIVRGLGPDTGTIKLLEKDGVPNCENIHRFLFPKNRVKADIKYAGEVWFVDEAGKASTDQLFELLKVADSNRVQVILSGDSSQNRPVGRGAPFYDLCQRLGSSRLVDIQRQNTDEKRELSKRIAVGDVGAALGKLTKTDRINWSETVSDSMTALVSEWKRDCKDLNRESSLIVAPTRKDVRILNQMVREIRQEWGEVVVEDVELPAIGGTVLVSRGDVIEFRKNDQKLNVSNGTVAVVQSVSKRKVIAKDKETGKTIRFKPSEYNSWTLGYASTNYRSQGRTVDRCYLLHGPSMGKPDFYVGLTRHVDAVRMFVSREKGRGLSWLRTQMLRTEKAPSLDKLLSKGEIDQLEKKGVRADQLSRLRTSDQFIERQKGRFLSLLDSTQEKIKGFIQPTLDRTESKEFFTVKEEVPDLLQLSRKNQAKASWSQVFTPDEVGLLCRYMDACDQVAEGGTDDQYKDRFEGVSELLSSVSRERLESALGATFVNRAKTIEKRHLGRYGAARVQQKKFDRLSSGASDCITPYLESCQQAGLVGKAKEDYPIALEAWSQRNGEALKVLKMLLKDSEAHLNKATLSLRDRISHPASSMVLSANAVVFAGKGKTNIDVGRVSSLMKENSLLSHVFQHAPRATSYQGPLSKEIQACLTDRTWNSLLIQAERATELVGSIRVHSVQWNKLSSDQKMPIVEYAEALRTSSALNGEVCSILKERLPSLESSVEIGRLRDLLQDRGISEPEIKISSFYSVQQWFGETKRRLQFSPSKDFDKSILSTAGSKVEEFCQSVKAHPKFSEWRAVCGKRNKDAYTIVNTCENRFSKICSPVYVSTMKEYAERHYTRTHGKAVKMLAFDRLSRNESHRDAFARYLQADCADPSSAAKALLSCGASQSDIKACLFPDEYQKILDSSKRSERFTDSPWMKLTPEKSAALRSFSEAYNSAGRLHGAYQETQREDIKYMWLSQCKERNAAAFEASKLVTRNEALSCLGKNKGKLLFEKAEKHREGLNRSEDLMHLESRLGDRISELACDLTGHRPTGKSSGSLRFGRKGSLSVTVSGPRAGMFYDFEKQEGGGGLTMIRNYRNCTFSEAVDYGKNFLGMPTLQIPSGWTSAPEKATSSWVSEPPPSDSETPPAKVIQGYRETARHAYRDQSRKLLFYVLRFESVESDDKKSKMTLPMTYGKMEQGKSHWRLKGWSNGPTIYGLDQLSSDSSKRVLIMEGEKAADAAKEKYGDLYACISWSGGCGAVSKVDWRQLEGRDVFIWPDNDEAGLKAGKDLAKSLIACGADKIRMVDPKDLSKDLPKGWDLADPLPEGVTEKSVRDRLLRSQEVAPRVSQIIASCSKASIFSDNKSALKELASDLVSLSMERRLGGDVMPSKMDRSAISEEVTALINGVKKTPEGVADRVTVEVLKYQASTGKPATDSVIEAIRHQLAQKKMTGKGIGQNPFSQQVDPKPFDASKTLDPEEIACQHIHGIDHHKNKRCSHSIDR
ncbi:hypothetical protein SCG7086_AR_00230, partial [Chlamydiales bacterium SCGC AG-110-P3]